MYCRRTQRRPYSGMSVFLYFGDFGWEGTGCFAICGGLSVLSVVPAPSLGGFALVGSRGFCLGLASLPMAPMQPADVPVTGREAMRASTLLARVNRSLSSWRSYPRASRMAGGILRRNISLKTMLFPRSLAGSSRSMFAAMMVADPSPMGGKSRKLDASCVSDGPKVSMTRLVKLSLDIRGSEYCQ